MKLLIISHNPVSRYNAMGKTLAAFLAEFRPEEVCQLYLYPAWPREGICSSFYRITDWEVLKSRLFGSLPGEPVDAEKTGWDAPAYDSSGEDLFYSHSRKKKPLYRGLRDAMWHNANWFHDGLKQWMAQEKPDCILAAGGDSLFFYEIALTLARVYDLPLVNYICDEYYFLSPAGGWIGRLRQKLLKEKMEELLYHSAHLVVISRELKQAYADHFSLPITVIMTGSSHPVREKARWEEPVRKLVYLGNLSYGRCHALADMGRALDAVNGKCGTGAVLEIYSAQQEPEMLACFSGIASLVFRGFVSGEALEAVKNQAQLFVHGEDFSPRNVELVRHSVSTKIPDCLASGIPLLAYGPKETASMAYLLEQNCAFAAVEKDQLVPVLERALFSPEERKEKAERALEAARRNHDCQANSRILKNLLQSIAEGHP